MNLLSNSVYSSQFTNSLFSLSCLSSRFPLKFHTYRWFLLNEFGFIDIENENEPLNSREVVFIPIRKWCVKHFHFDFNDFDKFFLIVKIWLKFTKNILLTELFQFIFFFLISKEVDVETPFQTARFYFFIQLISKCPLCNIIKWFFYIFFTRPQKVCRTFFFWKSLCNQIVAWWKSSFFKHNNS